MVFLDKLDHASIVDGAKMSYGETVRFNHGDLDSLERKLQQVPPGTGVMIIVDGIYSMEGDVADVPNLLKIAQKHGAALAIDDAHAVGVLGPRGDGTAAHFGLSDDVDIIVGTHRLLQKDVGFARLGLVVVDEEQRFGVAAKERLKRLRRENEILRQEREILKRAATFFAKEGSR